MSNQNPEKLFHKSRRQAYICPWLYSCILNCYFSIKWIYMPQNNFINICFPLFSKWKQSGSKAITHIINRLWDLSLPSYLFRFSFFFLIISWHSSPLKSIYVKVSLRTVLDESQAWNVYVIRQQRWRAENFCDRLFGARSLITKSHWWGNMTCLLSNRCLNLGHHLRNNKA